MENKRLNSYSNWTMEDIQVFVNSNHVVSKKELRRISSGLIKRYYKLKKLYPDKDIIFEKQHLFSFGEEFVLRELYKYGLEPNLVTQYRIKTASRDYIYDFYLKDYNSIIEVHGPQHFMEISKFNTTLKEVQDNDLEKYNLAKTKNIKIYYFTLDKLYYNRCGYFKKVYTDFVELLIDLTGNNNLIESSNYLEKINNKFSVNILELIEEAQKYIDEYSVTTADEFLKLNVTLYDKIKKYKLLNKMIYTNPSPDKADKRYINSAQDLNKVMRSFNIDTLSELRSDQFRYLYRLLENNSEWRDYLEFKINEGSFKNRFTVSLSEISEFMINNNLNLSELKNIRFEIWDWVHKNNWEFKVPIRLYNYWKPFNEVLPEDLIEFINKSNINTKWIYSHVDYRNLIYENSWSGILGLAMGRVKINYINTYQLVNVFLKINKITTENDFIKLNANLYKKVLKNDWLDKLIYYKDEKEI